MLQHTAVVVTCSEPAEPCASQRSDFLPFHSLVRLFFKILFTKQNQSTTSCFQGCEAFRGCKALTRRGMQLQGW